MAAETDVVYNVVGGEFVRLHDEQWKMITSDRAYSIIGSGGYGIRGKPAVEQYSWQQEMRAYPIKGFVGKGTGDLDKAFMSLRASDEVNLSHREAKYHMNKYLFGMKGGTGRRFRAVYDDAVANIKNFEMAILWYDNIIPNTEAWKEHIRKVAEFTSKHAGGIVGDHIKGHYFSASGRNWAPNTMGTTNRKMEQQAMYNSQYEDVHMPYANVPMWGITGRNTGLPDNWKTYTYKYGAWPRDSSLIKTVGFDVEGKPDRNVAGRAGLQRSAPFIIKRGRKGTSTMRGGGYAETNIPYSQRYGRTGRIFTPKKRSQLMDVVAYLAPTSGYKNSPRNGGRGTVWVGDILEPFHMTPWVFNHESGYTTNRGAKVPARPFITPGIKDGANDAARLMAEYMKDGTTSIRKGINLSGAAAYQASTIDAVYAVYHWEAIHKKYAGKAGIRAQQYTVFTSQWDRNIALVEAKARETKASTRSLFNTRHIWWFLPPSKYYHYIGMAFDIASIVMGGFWSMGAVSAWMEAMTKGMAGARMGTPVPFTSKARRRKFRKGLYTRAGYHRQGALGSGRGR